MGTYRIGMVRENSAEATHPGMNPSDNLVVTLDWFNAEYFEFRKEKVQKEIVKARLENLCKKDLGFKKIDIQREERIVIHKKPDYKMDEAIFDKEIVMPKNLAPRKTKRGFTL